MALRPCAGRRKATSKKGLLSHREEDSPFTAVDLAGTNPAYPDSHLAEVLTTQGDPNQIKEHEPATFTKSYSVQKRLGLCNNHWPLRRFNRRGTGCRFQARQTCPAEHEGEETSKNPNGRRALRYPLQPLSSRTLRHRANCRAVENDSNAHARARQFTGRAGPYHHEIPSGRQRQMTVQPMRAHENQNRDSTITTRFVPCCNGPASIDRRRH